LMRHVERGFGELHLGLGSVAARKPHCTARRALPRSGLYRVCGSF
jgi:hypothetical protein